jgi:DNA primase
MQVGHGLIPEDVINQIRERADITQVVSEYVSLSKAGQNYKGLCPFHAEKTPSFTVSPSRQMFHCFGCGAGGNVFTFLMKVEGREFPEAVREMGRRMGIAVPETGGRADGASKTDRDRLEQMNAAAAGWFRRTLSDPTTGSAGTAYLSQRGITPDTSDAFGLGLALPAWDGLLKALMREGFKPDELARGGLAAAKEQEGKRARDASGYYDRFRSRLMFPIYDLRRSVIGFGGRVLDDGLPKYLNSPETPLFNKGRALYALERAREAAGKSGTVVIVEGYFDAIALHQAGVTNVVATLGTALTPDHVRTLRRFATKIVLLFDPDEAGIRASVRSVDLFADSGLGVRVVSLPSGDDPDTFIRSHGAEAFHALVAEAPSLLDFAVDRCLQQASSGLLEDRLRSVDEILRILHNVRHRLEKEECVRRVAERLGVSERRLVERYGDVRPPERRPAQDRSSPPLSSSAVQTFKGSAEERELVHVLLQGLLEPGQVAALDVEAFSVPACRRIVEIGRKHVGEDGRVQVGRLIEEASQDPVCASVATELAILERHDDDLAAHVRGCFETLERKRRAQRLQELIHRLRRAEREGRADEAGRLNAEINAWRQQQAGGSPAPSAS